MSNAVPEQAVESVMTQDETREMLRSKLREATGYEWPRLVNDILAALPLMGVERPEDVARIIDPKAWTEVECAPEDRAIWALSRQKDRDAALAKARMILALPHTGQPQEEVRVILENHGQQSCYYGQLVSIEPYVAERRGGV